MSFDRPVVPVVSLEDVPHEEGQKLSGILMALATDESRERIAVSDLLLALQHRALGALLFIFALPNVLPTPPGTSAVLGAPLVFLAAQLTLGMRPWLPQIIAGRSIARKDFAALILRAAPWLARAETLLRPRLQFLAHRPMENVVGLICFILAVVLFLPIPLGNMLPALAICFLGLGVVERDGLWIIAGTLLGGVACVLVSGVVYAVVKSALYLIANAF